MTEDRAAAARARLLPVAVIRTIEAAAGSQGLMERAGDATARLAITMARDGGGPIVFLVGPGNNGGDALVGARALHRRGVDVQVALLAPANYKGDAARAWNEWNALGQPPIDDPAGAIASASLVVDGLFGIGFTRALDERARRWIGLINDAGCPVLAIDIPSGVDADTGHVADVAVEADCTLTFIADKPGLHTGDGVDHCGTIVVDTLGVDHASAGGGAINRPALFEGALTPRRRSSHKGTFGSVAVIGGSAGMVGAALMTARTALFAGAGRVYVRLLARHPPGFDALHPELMLRATLEGVEWTAAAIGPGLGIHEEALLELEGVLRDDRPLVLDADALNAIAAHPHFGLLVAERERRGQPPAVLTPHPLEAARLLETDARAVQRDRIAAATTLAARTGSIVVLKGAGTVIADSRGGWVINATGNPALATGGTGDVLCGLVAGLLAQGLAPPDAARAATWLHGTAADDLVASGIGPIGLTASELIDAIRLALNRLVAGH